MNSGEQTEWRMFSAILPTCLFVTSNKKSGFAMYMYGKNSISLCLQGRWCRIKYLIRTHLPMLVLLCSYKFFFVSVKNTLNNVRSGCMQRMVFWLFEGRLTPRRMRCCSFSPTRLFRHYFRDLLQRSFCQIYVGIT